MLVIITCDACQARLRIKRTSGRQGKQASGQSHVLDICDTRRAKQLMRIVRFETKSK